MNSVGILNCKQPLKSRKMGELAHSNYVKHIRSMKEVMDNLEAEHPRKEVNGKSGAVIKTQMKEIRKVSARDREIRQEDR